MNKLALVFGIPYLSALAVLSLPVGSGKNLKRMAFVLSLLPLLLLVFGESLVGSHIQMPWLSALSVEFYLRTDSLSLIFLYLTSVVIPLVILYESDEDLSYPRFFYGSVL